MFSTLQMRGGEGFISNRFENITNLLKGESISVCVDNIGLENLYSLGYCAGYSTLGKCIYRLEPGECMRIHDGNIEFQFYHEYGTKQIADDYDSAIENIDRLFRQAVARCFDKDLEYGYQNHLVDISGGNDCKLVSWVARDLGYDNILNVTYSKFDSDEMRAALESAIQMKNTSFYKPLDDCRFFFDYQKLVQKNYGLFIFCASTAADACLSEIDFSKFGLEHTGLLGDVIVGSYCKSAKDVEKDEDACLKSIAYFDAPEYMVATRRNFRNYEQYAIYLRGMQGITNSCLIRSEYTKAVSAFMDLDFMDYCLSLPVEWRIGHRIYNDWLRKKYPRFLSLPSTRMQKMTPKRLARKMIVKLITPWKAQIKKALYQNGLAGIVEGRNTMNPLNIWFSENKSIALDWDGFCSSCDKQILTKEQQDRSMNLYKNGNALEKAAVITLYAWIREFC